MEKQEISILQLEILVKSIDVLPDYIKSSFLKFFKNELLDKTLDAKKFAVRSAYNVFNLLSVIGSKELFLNGKVIFTVDLGTIYKHFAEEFNEQDSMELFSGCAISRDLTNTYITLNLSKILIKNSNLKFSTPNSIVIPMETLTINTKYNNTLISKLKELLI
jgi:hypothetical protein